MDHANQHSDEDPSGGDVSWQAFCYVCDELSSVERERFEQQLLDDQAAREAVAAAVELHAALVASREPVGAAGRPHWKAAAAAAACAAAVLLICLALPAPQPVGSARSHLQPALSTDLALQWASQLAEPAEDDLEWTAWGDPGSAAAMEATEATPDWMFLAVGAALDADDMIDGGNDTEEPL